jgi:hypothetical protein
VQDLGAGKSLFSFELYLLEIRELLITPGYTKQLHKERGSAHIKRW